MVNVENGIHLLEPGLFSQGCLEKGCENFLGRLFPHFQAEGKITKLLYTLKQHRNDFFSAFFILKFAANGRGEKAAN